MTLDDPNQNNVRRSEFRVLFISQLCSSGARVRAHPVRLFTARGGSPRARFSRMDTGRMDIGSCNLYAVSRYNKI